MIKLTPVEIKSKQGELAEFIAVELVREGFDSMLALPVAIGIMGVIQDALEADDLQAAIDSLKKRWKAEDEWWVEYHPKSKLGRSVKNGTRVGMNFYKYEVT